jgi:hypothetical protein
MTTDNYCFYTQNRLIQTSPTGGQWYRDTSPFSIPWLESRYWLWEREDDKREEKGNKRKRRKKKTEFDKEEREREQEKEQEVRKRRS